jgi:hypothetical protein
MKFVLAVLVACAITAPARAQEPAGCDKFKWPIEQERALLSGKTAAVASGTDVGSILPVAVTVKLVPFADAKLPSPPERAPKLAVSNAGFIEVGMPAHAGVYKVSLSAEGWIDVVQGGHLVKSQTFSGATGCEGIRKSVKFDLKTEPFAVQLSNVPTDSIGVAITGN